MFLLLTGCGVILVVTVVAIWRSKKPVKLILAEAKYEFLYNAMGSRAILEDILMRRRNKTELKARPGKVALITGGARGIGLEVVKKLLQCEMHVVIGCRNVQVAEQRLQTYKDESECPGATSVYQLDISSTESVKKFAKTVAEKHPKIDILINNAGIMFGPYIESKDGFESQLATNYLGHFLLCHLLLPQIKAAGSDSEKSRIVNVSSCAYLIGEINFDDINRRRFYITSAAYAQSKLAQVVFTNHLEDMFRKENVPVQVHSVHPGIVNTDLFNGTYLKNLAPWIPSLMFKSPEEGATPILHACLSPKLEGRGGTYIHNCKVFATNDLANSGELQEKLFSYTKELLKIKDFGLSDDTNNNT